ncbi:sortase domain-bontaining protein [Arthrobacter ruber]|uniref:sortase domain-containing protein n=1 Tax=Arthrobacter ruber TaxID=1258893 RepID=UPI000CF3DA14|nr:sortase [Arthrobacter ruber]
MTSKTSRISLRTATCLLGAALLVGGCAAPSTPEGGQPDSPAPAPSAALAASAGKIQDPSAPADTAVSPEAAPVRISIPAIDVDAPLEVLSLDAAAELQPPVDWQAAGWYDRSPVPGVRGPSVIAGHLTAPDGPAVFVDLGNLEPGDTVTVTQADGSTDDFAVNRTISAERTDSFPTEEIYGPTPDAQLRLITCDGEYDPARGHWTRNMIVFATALPE